MLEYDSKNNEEVRYKHIVWRRHFSLSVKKVSKGIFFCEALKEMQCT